MGSSRIGLDYSYERQNFSLSVASDDPKADFRHLRRHLTASAGNGIERRYPAETAIPCLAAHRNACLSAEIRAPSDWRSHCGQLAASVTRVVPARLSALFGD